MEELVSAMKNVVQALNVSQNAIWLVYLSALGPLVLTATSVFIACKQHRQNQNLQKQIANRDYINTLRQNALDIYNDYFYGLRVINRAIGNIVDIVSYYQSLQMWERDLQRAYEQIMVSYNRANLMFRDEGLLRSLKQSYDCFEKLYNKVSSYSRGEILKSIIQDAWSTISSKYGIALYDYASLSFNQTAREEFWKLCDNRHTQDIHKLMESYVETISNVNFDEYFKKYVQMDEL